MRVCVGVGGGGGGGAEGAPQLVLEEKDLQDRTAAPQLHTFHPRYAGKEMCAILIQLIIAQINETTTPSPSKLNT